ncbi:MAG TPA: hypothetical protein VMX17_04650 [Candidatus Glassbacteria bacterium]|nr:hypothetical protein [Candidatus Glassbacteria bacterium]
MIEITKKVTFNLDNDSDKIDMPDLLSKRYVRNHIIALFEELQSRGYGEFKQGTRGRGQSHKFIKNNKCPNTYSIYIEEKPRGRPRKNANIEAEVISHNPMKPQEDEISSNIYNDENKINIEDIKNNIKIIAEDTNLTGNVSNIAVLTKNKDEIPNVIINDEDEKNIIDGDAENIPF